MEQAAEKAGRTPKENAAEGNLPDTLGQRLRTLRKHRKLTQVDVAVAVGTSRTNLTKIERGEYLPGREVLMALATFFDVSLDWLASGQGSMKPGDAKAQTKEEALLLFAYRSLSPETAKPLLQMMLSQARQKGS